jgi:hypothetical protein
MKQYQNNSLNRVCFFNAKGNHSNVGRPSKSKGRLFFLSYFKQKQVYDVWKTLVYICCGETLTTHAKNYKYINGITISPKKNFCIVKIWLNTTEYQDPTFIKQIMNLPVQGCLFKKHEPEF